MLESYLATLNHKFTIVGISESWLKDHNADRYGLSGYNAIHKYRSTRARGGVSIFIQDDIEYFCRDDLCYQNDTIETVFIEIDKDHVGKEKNVIIGVIYRPPNTDIAEFNRYMTEILDKMKPENKMVACIGDYNISLMNVESHGPSQKFAEMMYSFSMYPCITKPTRVTTKSASLIDNIFCYSMPGSSMFTGILYTDISDHFPIFYIDKSLKNTNCPKY